MEMQPRAQHYDGKLEPDVENEDWASVEGYPYVLFSSQGRVKSKHGVLKPTWHGVRNYWVMEFTNAAGKRETKRVDALVYEAFKYHRLVFIYENFEYINGDRTDMRPENLRIIPVIRPGSLAGDRKRRN